MRTATAVTVPSAWPPAIAIVRGGDEPARRHSAGLLAGAGFQIRGTIAPGALVVLLGEVDEFERIRQIRALAQAHPAMLILALMPDGVRNASLRRALHAGATGIVLEGDVDRALAASAKAVLAGQLTAPSVLSGQIAPRALSHREKQVLGLVVGGSTNREIAHALYLSESTIKTHLSSAFRKLDASSRAEAAARVLDPEWGYGLGTLTVADGLAQASAG